MFRVGDKVVHPSHGAGILKEIRNSENMGGFGQYYIIELYANRLTIMVPTAKADSMGLRNADANLVNEAITILEKQPNYLPNDFKARQKDVSDKLNSGNIHLVAEVCRDLSWRSRGCRLTSTDARALEHARDFIISELAATLGYATDQADEFLSKILSKPSPSDVTVMGL